MRYSCIASSATYLIFFLAFLADAFSGGANPSTKQVLPAIPSSPVADPQRQPRTLAHEILEIEETALPTSPAMETLINTLISTTKTRIENSQSRLGSLTAREQALQTFAIIDRVFADLHFVYPGRGYVATLHDGLTPVNVDAEGLKRLGRRNDEDRLAPDATFYMADCDIYSFLYVAIGEALGLPISMVDLPSPPAGVSHNYVRWTLPDGSQVSWETTSGTERLPSRDDRPFFRAGPKTLEEAVGMRAFGVSMSHEETLGYAYFILGGIWTQLGADDRALAAYQASIQKHPLSPVAYNDAAWLLATSSNPTVRNPKEAIRLGEILVKLWPSANYLDTVAAAYAADGRFDDALRMQKLAISVASSYDPKASGFRQRCAAFAKRQTYLQPRRQEREMERAREALQNSQWGDLSIRVPTDRTQDLDLPPECQDGQKMNLERQ